jgi:hypothetical protein
MMLADCNGATAAEDACFGSSNEFQEYVRAFYEAYDPRRGPAEAFESYRRLVDSAHVAPSSVAATGPAARRAAPAPAVQQAILDELHALYPKALENVITTCLMRYAPRRLGTGEEATLIRSAGTFTRVAQRLMGQYGLTFASFLPDEPQLRAVTECREVWASFFGQIPGLEAQQQGDTAAATSDAAAMEEDLVRRIDAASGAVLDAASTVRQFYDGCFRDATPAQRRRAVLWKAVFTADAQLALSVDDMLLRADGDVKQALEAFRDAQARNCERRCLEDHMVHQLGLSADDAVAATRRAMTSRTPGTDLFKSLHYDTHQQHRGGSAAVVSPSFHSSPDGPGGHGSRSAATSRHYSPDRRSLLAVEMSRLHQQHSPASSPAARGPAQEGGGFGNAASLVTAYMRLRHDGRRATPPPSGIISPSAPFSSSLGGVVNPSSSGGGGGGSGGRGHSDAPPAARGQPAAGSFDGDEVDLEVPSTREPPRGPGELSIPRERAAVPAASREWVPPAGTQQSSPGQRRDQRAADAPPDVSAIGPPRQPAAPEEESIAVRLARRIAAQQRELDGIAGGNAPASSGRPAAHDPPSAVKKTAASPSAAPASSPSPSQKKTITFGADPRELRVPSRQQQQDGLMPQRAAAATATVDDDSLHQDTPLGRSPTSGTNTSALDASAMSAQRQRNDDAHARNEADRIAIEDAKAELRRVERSRPPRGRSCGAPERARALRRGARNAAARARGARGRVRPAQVPQRDQGERAAAPRGCARGGGQQGPGRGPAAQGNLHRALCP